MSTAESVTLASASSYELGEGPLWDPGRELVMWVDILGGAVHSGRLGDDGRILEVGRTAFGQTVGAFALAADGSWIVAGAPTLCLHPAEGPDRELARIIPSGAARRTNDGKPDPAGRFLIGTLSLDDESHSEGLVRLEDDGSITTIDDDLGLSNGLAWSPDGRTMYSIDTIRRVLYVRSYDAATGATGERRVLIEFDGYPDGMTTDAEGHLWIAMWGLGEIRCYSPDGRLERVLPVPAPNTTSVAFAGPELDTLVITTATQHLSRAQLAAAPLSGHLFTVRPGVRGLPSPMWNGSSAQGFMRAG